MEKALTGRANIYFQEIAEDNKQQITDILQQLKLQFGRESKDALFQYTVALDRKQQPKEAVQSYTTAMIKAFHKVNMTDKRHRLALYIEGLRPEIKNQMLLMKSQNLQEAEQNAMIIEKTLDQDQQNLSKIIQILQDTVQKQREISAIQ